VRYIEGLLTKTGPYSETGLVERGARRGVGWLREPDWASEGDWAYTARLGSNSETGLEPRGRKERKMRPGIHLEIRRVHQTRHLLMNATSGLTSRSALRPLSRI